MPDSILIEELGVTCANTIDGHKIEDLKACIDKALSYNGPVLIHAVTRKGAGYKPAADNPELFHGIGPYDIETGKPVSSSNKTFTNIFDDTIINLAKKDDKIVALTAAMAGGTGLKNFSKLYPERFVDVGIAEEHLVGTAAGLAKNGLKPVVAVYSAFLQRAIDQMIINTSLENLNTVFCIDRAGLVGKDGVSHHGIFDISYCRMIPNLKIIAPSSAYELQRALETAINEDGPYAIRYPRGEAPEIDSDGKIHKDYFDGEFSKFRLAKSRTLKKGKDAAILAFGTTVVEALKAHKMLKKDGIKARVVDMRWVKPLDVDVIKKAVKETNNIVTVEDGILAGGAGSAVLEEIAKSGLLYDCSFKSLGIDDKFVTHGDVDKLKTTVNIDSDSIYKTVASMIY